MQTLHYFGPEQNSGWWVLTLNEVLFQMFEEKVSESTYFIENYWHEKLI